MPEVEALQAWARKVLGLQPIAMGESHATFVRNPQLVRDAAIALTLLGTAARRFELCNFTCGDIRVVEGEPRMWFEAGKGNLQAEIPISDDTYAMLRRWLQYKSTFGEPTGPQAPLFQSRVQGHLSVAQLHNIWKGILVTVGIHDPKAKTRARGVHCTRHTAGMLFLKSTDSMSQLATFLRHTNQATTEQFYKHMQPSQIRAGLNKAGL